jgi:hypothetical protein
MTVDLAGGFDIFDASNGVLITRRSVTQDAGGGPSVANFDPGNPTGSLIGALGALTSAGPSIAEGRVFVPNGGALVAYGL